MRMNYGVNRTDWVWLISIFLCIGKGPYPASSMSFNDGSSKSRRGNTSGGNISSGGDASTKRPPVNSCGPCDMYQQHMKKIDKDAADAGLAGSVTHPQFFCPQGRIMQDAFCEYVGKNFGCLVVAGFEESEKVKPWSFPRRISVLEKLNREQMSRAPSHPLEGVIQGTNFPLGFPYFADERLLIILAGFPFLWFRFGWVADYDAPQTSAKDWGLFRKVLSRWPWIGQRWYLLGAFTFPLASSNCSFSLIVCNPAGGSYMTARPFRCQTIYRYCEPVVPTYAGKPRKLIEIYGRLDPNVLFIQRACPGGAVCRRRTSWARHPERHQVHDLPNLSKHLL